MTTLGRFRFDAANQRLHCGVTKTDLTQKATAILGVLTKRRNQLVTHEELLDSVWQGVHVQPEVLKVYISELRRALRDSADNPRYIQTVHRRGYKLVIAASLRDSIRKNHDRVDCFVGRSTDIVNLNGSLRKAAAGEPQLVFVTGEAGAGKTTLLRRFLRRVERRPGVRTALAGVAHAHSEAEPFSLVLNAVRELLTPPDAAPLLDVFRHSAPCWAVQFPSLLDSEETARISQQLTGSTSQRMIREFAEALNRCCRESLIVLAFDDVDRADTSSLHLLEHLAHSGTRGNLLIIAAANEAQAPDRFRSLKGTLQSRRLCDEIKLKVFSCDTVRRFLDAKYPQSAVGGVLAGRLHRLTGGLPLFLASAVQHIEAQHWIIKAGKEWVTTVEAVPLEELIPPVLNDLLELEIRQLASEDQQVLEAASIVGSEFSTHLVADATGKPSAVVEDTCNRLVRGRKWIEFAGFDPLSNGSVTARFRFLHVLARDVLYGRQSEAERVRKHSRVAVALEKTLGLRAHGSASELAFHFAAGGVCSKSIEYLRAAAATASHRFAGAEAAALLTEAIRLTSRMGEPAKILAELELLDELGSAYLTCGNFEGCTHAWHQAASLAIKHGRNDIAIRAMSRLAFPVGWDNPVKFRAALARIFDQIRNIDEPVTRSEVMIRVLSLRDIAGEWKPGDDAIANRAMDDIVHDGDPVRIASARIPYAWFRVRTSAYKEAIADVTRSLHVVLQHDPVDAVRAEWVLGWALLHDGQWGRMQSTVMAAAEHATKNGSRRIAALFDLQLAWLHLECGDYSSAQTLCERASNALGKPARGVGVVMCYVIASMAEAGLNHADAALDFLQRASAANSQKDAFWHALAEICAVKAHLINDKPSRVQYSAQRLLQLSMNLRDQTWKAISLATCARASLRLGDATHAYEYSSAAMELVQHAWLPLAKWRVEAVAADVVEMMTVGRADRGAVPLRHRSRKSRHKLYDSLGVRDPLRRFGKIDSESLRLVAAAGRR